MIELIQYGVVVPIVVSVVAALLTGLVRPFPPSRLPVLLVTLPFVVTYVAVKWTPIWPKLHWHALFPLCVCAFVLGPVAVARRRSLIDLAGTLAVLAAVAACWLVPERKNLADVRALHLAVLAGAILVTSVAMIRMALSSRLWLATVMVLGSGGISAAMLLESGNLKLSLLCLAGHLGVAGWWVRRRSCRPRGVAAAMPWIALLQCGLLYAGYINSFSDLPWSAYAAVPIALSAGCVAVAQWNRWLASRVSGEAT